MSALALPRTRAVPLAYAYGLVGVVGATVLVVSAYYLHELAIAVKMPAELAWTLPVALDVGAAFGTVCWMIAEDDGEARRFGRGFALSCLAGTLVGNGLAHLLDFHVFVVNPWLAVGVCSVFPVILFAIVHLVLLLRREQSAAEQLVEDASPIDPAPAVDASPTDQLPSRDASPIDRVPTQPSVSEEAPRVPADTSADGSGEAGRPAPRRFRSSTVAQRKRWIEAELDAGREVTGGQVERKFYSRNGAREVAQVKAERAASSERAVA
jgi:hypothetical protein